jgi:hypothetical protein
MRFSCSAVDPDTTSEMPRVVEGSHATSDHAELPSTRVAELPSMGVEDVEGPGGGRAAAAGEVVAAMRPRPWISALPFVACYHPAQSLHSVFIPQNVSFCTARFPNHCK